MSDRPWPVLPLLSLKSNRLKTELLTCLRDELPEENIDLVENFSSQELANADVAIADNPDVSMFTHLPRLRWLQSMWAGVENLVELARNNNLQLVRLVDPQLALNMSETTLAWTLFLHLRMTEYAELQRDKRWQQLGHTTAGNRRVSLLGLGQLGTACAQRLADHGFSVSAWSSGHKTLPGVTCCSGPKALADMLSKTDILIVLLPLTKKTNNLIDKQALSLLPATASLINFARGPIVNTNALLDALDHNQLNHAVLDVFDQEPLPASSPLWQHNKVTVLPHIAAPTSPRTAAKIAALNIRNYRTKGEIPEPVDLDKGF